MYKILYIFIIAINIFSGCVFNSMQEYPTYIMPAKVAQESQEVAAFLIETTTIGEIKQMLDIWALAWFAKDLETYLSCYSDKFPDRYIWEKQRHQAIQAEGVIRVMLTDIKVTLLDEENAQVTFIQNYWSNQREDEVRKMLSLHKEHETWKIVEELSVS